MARIAPLSELITPADKAAEAIERHADRHGYYVTAGYREENERQMAAICVRVHPMNSARGIEPSVLRLELDPLTDSAHAVRIVDAAIRALSAG